LNLKEHSLNRTAYIFFIFTVIAFNIGAIIGIGRIWAFNYWSLWPYPLLLFISGCLIIFAGILFKRADITSPKKLRPQKKQDAKSKYWIQVSILAAAFSFAFVLFRTQLHFLGDGYSLLSELSSDTPIIKPRNYLGTMPQYWIYQLLNGSGWKDALISYRIISFSAGLISLAVLAVSLNSLFKKRQDRLLAFLGVVSGGTTLLFFGYVENYALFNAIVLAFCLIGMLAAENKISKLWVIPLVGGSVFFHYFGVALIPATAYLLLCNTRFGIIISKMPKIVKILITGFVLTLAILSFIWLYKNSYAFRFALVPIIEDQFTLEGYTLFSPAHLIDYLNLLFLLMPGLLIALTGLLAGKIDLKGPKQRTVFLLLAFISTLGLAFFIDPKLGMARDWDLLAFAGLPFALLVIDIYLRRQSSKSHARLTVKMIVIIGIFILISRAVNLIDAKAAIGLLDNNMRLDWLKHSTVIYSFKQYVDWGGERTPVISMVRTYKERFPGIIVAEAIRNFSELNYEKAAKGFEQEIYFHPQRASPYGYLAKCQMQAGLYDSAITLLEIAHGFDSYNLGIIDDLGSCYAVRGNFKKARKFLLKSLSLEKDHIPALAKLTTLFLSNGEIQKSLEYFDRLRDRHETSPMYFIAIGNDYQSLGYSQYALQAYREAIKRGIPEDIEKELKARHLELKD